MEIVKQKTALEHLPTEMWNKVSVDLDKEEDVLSFYNTSALFRDMVKPKVFAQALAIVQRQVVGTSSELEEKDLLSCRLVSRDWRKATDHFLQSHASRLDLACYRPVSTLGFQHSFNDQLVNSNRFGSICLRMGHLDEAHALVEQITSNFLVKKGANVTIGRHLILIGCRPSVLYENPRDPEKQRFYDIVSRLLTACGQHIWYLSFADSISDGLPHLFFHTCWNWLRLTPHLKMFTCQVTTAGWTPERQLELQQQLQEGVTQAPFPRLPQLVTLQSNCLPDLLIHSALEVNRQVKKVEVVPFRYSSEFTLDIQRWGPTPLTDFCLIPFKVEELQQITETGWPLEKLMIKFDLDFGPQQKKIEAQLEKISNFGETLKYLRLEVPYTIPHPANRQWQLGLPHLEELHLDVMHHARIDFMMPLVSLKKLKLSVMYYEVDVEPEIIFQGRTTLISKLYESQIWVEISTLKEVEVQLLRIDDQITANLNFNRKKFEMYGN